MDEQGIAYIVDLALPVGDGWLPVTFGERPGPAGGLRFDAGAEPEACLRGDTGQIANLVSLRLSVFGFTTFNTGYRSIKSYGRVQNGLVGAPLASAPGRVQDPPLPLILNAPKSYHIPARNVPTAKQRGDDTAQAAKE